MQDFLVKVQFSYRTFSKCKATSSIRSAFALTALDQSLKWTKKSKVKLVESCTLSKWLKEDLNSFICCWLIPLASRVKIWVSISLMVRAMVVRSSSHPTRMCCRCGDKADALTQGNLNLSSIEYWMLFTLQYFTVILATLTHECAFISFLYVNFNIHSNSMSSLVFANGVHACTGYSAYSYDTVCHCSVPP